MQTPGPPFSIQMGSPSGFRRLFITLFPLTRVYIDDSYCICIDPLQRLSAYPKFWFGARKNFPLSFLSHLSPSHTLPRQTPSFTRAQTCLMAPCFAFDPRRCHVKLCFCFVDVMTMASTILMMW